MKKYFNKHVLNQHLYRSYIPAAYYKIKITEYTSRGLAVKAMKRLKVWNYIRLVQGRDPNGKFNTKWVLIRCCC